MQLSKLLQSFHHILLLDLWTYSTKCSNKLLAVEITHLLESKISTHCFWLTPRPEESPHYPLVVSQGNKNKENKDALTSWWSSVEGGDRDKPLRNLVLLHSLDYKKGRATKSAIQETLGNFSSLLPYLPIPSSWCCFLLTWPSSLGISLTIQIHEKKIQGLSTIAQRHLILFRDHLPLVCFETSIFVKLPITKPLQICSLDFYLDNLPLKFYFSNIELSLYNPFRKRKKLSSTYIPKQEKKKRLLRSLRLIHMQERQRAERKAPQDPPQEHLDLFTRILLQCPACRNELV